MYLGEEVDVALEALEFSLHRPVKSFSAILPTQTPSDLFFLSDVLKG